MGSEHQIQEAYMEQNRTDPRWLDEDGTPLDEDHRGLTYDIRTLVDRRRALGLFGGIAASVLLAACAPLDPSSRSSASPSTTTEATTTPTPTAAASLAEVPDETAGPYPGDGSNGINVLDDSGIVRRDLRSSFGSSTTTVSGVPLEVVLTVRDASTGAALPGAGVYLWHCTREGEYSLYGRGLENENYLRGVQAADATGTVRFTTIYPGCYSGRWPHIHFEVYADVDTAVANGPIVKTSQIALPQETSEAVYAVARYETSVRNLAQTSLRRDNVFGDDNGISQLATMTGAVAGGYTAALTIGV